MSEMQASLMWLGAAAFAAALGWAFTEINRRLKRIESLLELEKR